MQKAGIVALAPSALIPALGPIIGIGLVSVALFKLLKDDDLGSELESNAVSSTGGQKALRIDCLNECQLEENDAAVDRQQTHQTVSDLEKQEMIRLDMSELGKRSGAARAKKSQQ